MKKLPLIILLSWQASLSFAQPITGIKSIPGDYPTIAYAFSQLNLYGTASPGVTFNIASGYVESASSLVLNTNTSSASAPIVFQKASGAAVNPRINASGAGVYSQEGVVVIAGSDFVTFDGIDIYAYDNTIDWGYGLVKKSGTAPFDGCQNVTIRNCVISMNRSNSNAIGIYAGNHTAASSSSLSITSATDACNNCAFYGNTISNVFYGFSINGYNASSPYTLYDQNNQIGVTAPNTITNFGGGYTVSAIYAQYQNGINISGNVTSSGTVTTPPSISVTGISLTGGTTSSATISNNTISLSFSGANGQTMYGIYLSFGSSGTSNILNINNNAITNCILNGIGNMSFYGITNTISNSGPNTLNMNDNTVHDITMPGAGYFVAIDAGSATNINNNGNLVYNVTLSGSASSWMIRAGTGKIVQHDNMIHDVAVNSGANTLYGMYNFANPTNETYYNNQIYNLNHQGNGPVYGMYIYTASGIRQSYSNTIHTLSSNGGVVYGMYYGSSSSNIYKNTVYDLVSNTVTGQVNGIYIYTGNAVSLWNNTISDLRTPASNLVNAITGLYIGSSSPTYVHYNTIYLNAASSSATTFGTAGILFSTYGSNTELKNNLIINTSVPVSAGGAAYTVAFQLSSAAFNNYATTSNNNCYYAGVPGPNNLIYFDGTNGDQSLPLFKARVTPRESASVSELPPFNDAANHDFHLLAGSPTGAESGGLRILSPNAVTTDFEGDIRWGEAGYAGTGTAPDMGVDEGNFTPMPVMNYQSSTTEQVAGSTFSGTTNQPVIRIRITVAGGATPLTMTQFKINAAGTTAITDINAAVSKIYYTGNSAFYGPGIQFGTATLTLADFTISGSQVLMPGDNYFWLVYDVVQTAQTGHVLDGQCVSFTLGGNTLVPSMTSPSGAMPILGPMAGTYYVGAGNSYPHFITLTEAVNNLNHRGVQGPVVFSLTNDSGLPYNQSNGEAFPIVLGVIPFATAVNQITIQPAPGVSPVISGSSTSAVIKLNGTDYLTINGSGTGGTSRNLTIENTNPAHLASTLQIASFGTGAGCLNITVKNCIIHGGTTGGNAAYSYTISVGAAVGSPGDDNRNLTLDNNQIDRGYYGIYIGGTSALSDGLTLTSNVIGSDMAGYYVGFTGIYLGNVQGLISNNVIKGIVSSTVTTRGIFAAAGVRNTQILRNDIHGVRGVTGSGVNGVGIELDLASAGNNITVANNLIYDITGDGSSNLYSYGTAGIKISGISTNVKIWHNTINLNGMISHSATADASAALFVWLSATQIDVRNNILVNAIENTTGVAKAYGFYSAAASSAFTNIDYNDYYLPGRESILGYFGGSDRTSLAAWQTATGLDSHSLNLDPDLNSNQLLIPYPGSHILDQCPVLSVSDDYTGATRTAPVSMGAYEAGNDLTPPVVDYLPLYNTHQLTPRVLQATITDHYTTVPSSGTGLPRLYWKINTNPWNIVTGTWMSGNIYQFTFGNGVSMGDQVSYFFVCQDNMPMPNVGATPSTGASGFTATPPACVNPPANPSVYTIVGGLSGIKNIPWDYPNLTGASGFFADMNSKALSGNLTVRINDNLTEDGTNALNEINTEDPSYKLTITNNGNHHTITGSFSGALIRFNGTDNVTLNGKGKMLISNTMSTPSVALSLSGGCNGNIIDSCSFSCGNMVWNPANYGIYFTGPGNNNMFRNDTITRAYYGIYLNGTYFGQASGNMILRNVVGSFNSANYISNNGIFAQYQDHLLISGNQVFNMIGNASPIGIYTEGITNSIIEKNDIHDIVYNGSSYGGASGITFTSLNSNPGVTIRNNMIRHISGMGSSPNTGDGNSIPAGIKLFGNASAGIQLYYNSIYMTRDASYGIFYNNEWFTALEIGMGVSGITMKNNILQNSVGEWNNSSITSWAYAVYTKSLTSPFAAINNNLYFSSNADNNFVGLRGTTTPPVNSMNLADWKSFTTQDGLSLNSDPLYTSLTSLTPQPSSPAIGAGAPLPGIVDDDVYGHPRGTSTTIGAVEMVSTSTKTLTVSLFLQGLYKGSGLMQVAMDQQGPKWGSSIADHISVELHDATPGNYSSIVYTIQDIPLSTAGTATVFVPSGFAGSYYLTIRHRNGLPTVSSTPVSFAGVSVNYSFDLPAKAFGNRLVLLPDGMYGIYSGDVDQNSTISRTDLSGFTSEAILFTTGYHPDDVNGDGIIDSADMTIIDNNAAAGITSVTP